MATNFFELATTLKNLGAKWLSEKKVNFTPWNVFFFLHFTGYDYLVTELHFIQFVITGMITDWIRLHLVLLPLFLEKYFEVLWNKLDTTSV